MIARHEQTLRLNQGGFCKEQEKNRADLFHLLTKRELLPVLTKKSYAEKYTKGKKEQLNNKKGRAE